MKWFIPGIWLASILFAHLRGKTRLPLGRQLLDHSVLLAPINAFMVLVSRVPTSPYLSSKMIPSLQALDDNWELIRDEALKMAELQHIKAAERHDDIGFNSFFKYGWKRFYLKWYDANHPSAEMLCPKTVALLKSIPEVKAAMFAELPAGGKLNPHRDPFAGSLRYHLGLATPNDAGCSIVVDGQAYTWHDGESVMFDETYVHNAYNQTRENRIILFCDVERPPEMGLGASLQPVVRPQGHVRRQFAKRYWRPNGRHQPFDAPALDRRSETQTIQKLESHGVQG